MNNYISTIFNFGKRSQGDQGFTLIELITAVSIFIIIMFISMGSILGIFDSNRKARALRTVMTDLNTAIESMSKEIRFGSNYHCGSDGTLSSPQDCDSGDSFISFLSSDGVQTTYRLGSSNIEKSEDGYSYTSITGPEVGVDGLTFYVLGSDSGDELQPKVILIIKSHAGEGVGRTDFTLQTMVSQRSLDNI